ncbi:hypothetical protein BS47DRAFT_1464083 [Hydnum rufescens UP504]|uniref:DM2 domain-containing protein n=1 Tax=Hydnum rufescens UP504 TaxID=1448309 RepID=A0A9P6DSS1_9AGAM|nr:hypothetical protein BS47DRAFT_1464083 [Hydnum rufescens UP504]
MFKKAFQEKSSAPLRTSDRRKLRTSVVAQVFSANVEPNVPDAQREGLIPEGLKIAKFITHLNEHGVSLNILYLSADGDPLWFTLDHNGALMIPTMYTLWKLEILPIITTPPTAIQKVLGGADLMIPGVIESFQDGSLPLIPENGLVAVAEANSLIPLAVGRMALPSPDIKRDGKGRAVRILHTWKDTLWEIGSKPEPPDSIPTLRLTSPTFPVEPSPGSVDKGAAPVESESIPMPSLKADAILRKALIQAITKIIKLSSSTFPMSSSTFYSAHILPSRPASSEKGPSSSELVKRSSYKKVSKFLQAVEKEGLLKLKDFKGDLNILSVNATHQDVIMHRSFKTVGDVETMESRSREAELPVQHMTIVELYKPHTQSLAFFQQLDNTVLKDLYTVPELRTIIDSYVNTHSLVHPREPAFITLDNTLRDLLLEKNEELDFLKREELTPRLRNVMQPWYSISVNDKEPVIKKGELKPIAVICKIRQGRKVSTFITGFEPFSISSEFLCEELRKLCASATSGTSLQLMHWGQ